MILHLKRTVRTEPSTLGELRVDGRFVCFTLEDRDRGLTSAMPTARIQALKVAGKTAIPTGSYRVTIDRSPRFNVLMPLLHYVLGFLGVRMHWGNKPEDTEGCILVGFTNAADWIGESRKAYAHVYNLIAEALARRETVTLIVE